MQGIIINITIDGSDLDLNHDYIEQMTVEDEVKKDNLFTITVRDEHAKYLADHEDLVTGAYMSIQFGYMAGELSPVHRVRITDIEVSYAERITMKIMALDKGHIMKKVASNKIWKNKTSSQIVREIADKYGLSVQLDETSVTWKSLPQGNKSDFDFLKYIAKREKDGEFISYVRETTLYFVRRGLDKDSALKFTYLDDERLFAFRPKWKETNNDGSASSMTLSGENGNTKKLGQSTITDGKSIGETNLGDYPLVWNYNQNGDLLNKTKKLLANGSTVANDYIKDKANTPSKNLVSPDPGNLGSSLSKKNKQKILTAELVTIGMPNAEPNEIITMSGVAQRHSGNWLVTEIKHSLTSRGFETIRGMVKNGMNKATGIKKADKTNKTVGKDKKENTIKVRIYNNNGDQIN